MERKTFALVILLTLFTFIAACMPTSPQSSTAVEDTNGLIDTLRAEGVRVESGGTLSQAFFSVVGRVITVNGADVQVFEYPDAAAARTEASLISADGGSVGTTMVTWVATPHFYTKGRLIVLYVGDDADMRGILEFALGPQLNMPHVWAMLNKTFALRIGESATVSSEDVGVTLNNVALAECDVVESGDPCVSEIVNVTIKSRGNTSDITLTNIEPQKTVEDHTIEFVDLATFWSKRMGRGWGAMFIVRKGG